MKDHLFPRGCDSARVIPVIETQSARGSGAADQPTRVVVEYWSLAGEKLAERDNYPLACGNEITSPQCGRDKNGTFRCVCGRCRELPHNKSQNGGDGSNDSGQS